MTTPTKAAKASRERYATAFVDWGLSGLRCAASVVDVDVVHYVGVRTGTPWAYGRRRSL
jgi:hypothetical protein